MNTIKFKILPAAACLVFIMALFLTGCEKKKEEKVEAYRVPVQVVQVEKRVFQDQLEFPGTTDTFIITKVSFMASGTIEDIYFDVGMPVKKGDIMARLDQKQYIDNVNSAQSQVGYANANLAKARAGSRDQEVKMALAGMNQAKANLENAQKEMERYRKAYQEDAVAEERYSNMVSQYKVAKESYVSARKNYEMTKEGTRKEDLDIARSNVNVSAAGLQSAQTQLAYTILRSPIDGVVVSKMMDVGAMASPQSPVFEIQSSQALDFTIYVPDIHIKKIHIGQEAEVEFFKDPDRQIKAGVREIQPLADSHTRSYRVKLRLKEAPGMKNYSGEIGKALFLTGPKIPGIFVPLSALIKKEAEKQFYIFYLDDQEKACKVEVKVISIRNQNAKIVPIESGKPIPPDARVIISGQEYVKDGSLCKVVTAVDSWKYVTPDKEPTPEPPTNNL